MINQQGRCKLISMMRGLDLAPCWTLSHPERLDRRVCMTPCWQGTRRVQCSGNFVVLASSCQKDGASTVILDRMNPAKTVWVPFTACPTFYGIAILGRAVAATAALQSQQQAELVPSFTLSCRQRLLQQTRHLSTAPRVLSYLRFAVVQRTSPMRTNVSPYTT